jgi:hypothetical protein
MAQDLRKVIQGHVSWSLLKIPIGKISQSQNKFSERGKKGPNFETGINMVLVTENLNLMLFTVPSHLASNSIEDRGKGNRK